MTTATATATSFGKKILEMLSMTRSVARLVEYFRDTEYFSNCSPIDKFKPGYLYSIQLNRWRDATGIDAETLSTRWTDADTLPATEDGRIWVDHYFERDSSGDGYQEDDGPRYVFISLYDYNGEFDDDHSTDQRSSSNACIDDDFDYSDMPDLEPVINA
jgi:hypothetical protein